jgi:RNA 3'-terminal phosphate cyclase (ATP)
VRTAVSLSAATGKPVHLLNIRTGAKSRGIQSAHLAAIQAVGIACGGKAAGAKVGSVEMYFEPGTINAGDVRVSVPNSGAVTPVLLAVALPLMLADGPSRAGFIGSTHLPGKPTSDSILTNWMPSIRSLGPPVTVKVEKTGFPPAGGGAILALIPGGARFKPLTVKVRDNLRSIRGRVYASKQNPEFTEVVAREARRGLRRSGVAVRVDIVERRSTSPGCCLPVEALLYNEIRVGFSSLGGGKRTAERIGQDAVNGLFEWLDSGAAVPGREADQLLLPLAFAAGPSRFTVSRITHEIIDCAAMIPRFLPTKVELDGKEGAPGEVRIQPAP